MAHREVHYAVVGLGHIAQVAVLPAFKHAPSAKLSALFSGDPVKREKLGKTYGVDAAYDYDQYTEILDGGGIDAVYIALPNHLHCKYAVRAAEAGVHVLVEKPMAVDENECAAMIEAAATNNVKLMIAYRLHFDPANLEAVQIVREDRLGMPRVFASSFTNDVVEGNVRLMPVARGGGPVYDLGVYCINAARYLFRDEPIAVVATAASRDDPRFRDSPETVCATLRFPGERLASFVCSFGAADSSRFEVIGDRGRLVMEPAYEYATGLRYELEIPDAPGKVERFRKHDQFGAELEYFARCILDDTAVEPDGFEGLADVHIIAAIHRSIDEGKMIELLPVRQQSRPDLRQAFDLPGV